MQVPAMRRIASQCPPTRLDVRIGASAHRGASRALEGEPVSHPATDRIASRWAQVQGTEPLCAMEKHAQKLEMLLRELTAFDN